MKNHYIKSILILLVGVLLYATDRDICEISVENQEGWNLVGLPVYVSDNSYNILFPGSIENTLFSFSDGTYTSEDELILGEGYWLRFSEDQSDTLIGECIDDFTISMSEGWNLISVVSHPVSVDEIIDTDGIIIDGTVFGFSGGYYEPTILEMGKGYWVRCFNDGEITIPDIEETDTTPPSVSIQSPVSGQTVHELVTIEVSAQDNVGIDRVEFIVDDSLMFTDTELPYQYDWYTSQYQDG
ncbi:uncharacterized protein METZ01_LOCUS432065, partial [marine metagenome]